MWSSAEAELFGGIPANFLDYKTKRDHLTDMHGKVAPKGVVAQFNKTASFRKCRRIAKKLCFFGLTLELWPCAEAPCAGLVLLDRAEELLAREIRPETVKEDELGIGRLPQ